MHHSARYEHDDTGPCTYRLTWRSADGENFTATVHGVRLAESELGISAAQAIEQGSIVQVASDNEAESEFIVRDCRRSGGNYVISLRLHEPTPDTVHRPKREELEDYYETLQISETADAEAIHRVFRLMAARFHPDNPETGDLEVFVGLTRAYDVLSNAARRAEYDEARRAKKNGPMKIFGLKDFVVGVEAEENRRLGVLTLLYNQRRTDPDHPTVSLLDLERWMALPREYLNFTTWYLKAKRLVHMGDSCDLMLTAEGVDFVEENAGRSEILSSILMDGRAKIEEARAREKVGEKWLRFTRNRGLPAAANA